MDFRAGDWVQHRIGFGAHKIGRVQSRVGEYDTYYVTAGIGLTYCSNGRDLRPVPAPDQPPEWSR